MPLALLDSVRRAEGAHGVSDYLTEKLAYMPNKVRKAPIKTEDAIDNVRRVLGEYLKQQQPFQVKEMCERANVTPSWLYRKDNPAGQMVLEEVKAAQAMLGKGSRARHLQAVPPEPVALDRPAIARDWLDAQIQAHERIVKELQARWVEIERQQQDKRRKVALLEQELEHLYKVRSLTEKASD